MRETAKTHNALWSLLMTEDGVAKVRIKKVAPPKESATSSSTVKPD